MTMQFPRLVMENGIALTPQVIHLFSHIFAAHSGKLWVEQAKTIFTKIPLARHRCIQTLNLTRILGLKTGEDVFEHLWNMDSNNPIILTSTRYLKDFAGVGECKSAAKLSWNWSEQVA